MCKPTQLLSTFVQNLCTNKAFITTMYKTEPSPLPKIAYKDTTTDVHTECVTKNLIFFLFALNITKFPTSKQYQCETAHPQAQSFQCCTYLFFFSSLSLEYTFHSLLLSMPEHHHHHHHHQSSSLSSTFFSMIVQLSQLKQFALYSRFRLSTHSDFTNLTPH